MEATAGESSLESVRAGPGRAEPKLRLSPIIYHLSLFTYHPLRFTFASLRLCVRFFFDWLR